MVFDVVIVHAADMEIMRTAAEAFYTLLTFNYDHALKMLSEVSELHCYISLNLLNIILLYLSVIFCVLLWCSRLGSYRRHVNNFLIQFYIQMVDSQVDASYKELLSKEFTKLVLPKQATSKLDRAQKSHYIRILEEVVFNVRSILCVK